MTDLIRVGEGYYMGTNAANRVPLLHRGAVEHVLAQMRHVTHRMVLNGERERADQPGVVGEREEASQPALRRVFSIEGQEDDVK